MAFSLVGSQDRSQRVLVYHLLKLLYVFSAARRKSRNPLYGTRFEVFGAYSRQLMEHCASSSEKHAPKRPSTSAYSLRML